MSTSKGTASGHFTATPQVSHNRKMKLCALTQSESLPLSCLMWPAILYLKFRISNVFDLSLSSQLLSSLLLLQPYAKTEPCNPAKSLHKRYVTTTFLIPKTLQLNPCTCVDSQHVAITYNRDMPHVT